MGSWKMVTENLDRSFVLRSFGRAFVRSFARSCGRAFVRSFARVGACLLIRFVRLLVWFVRSLVGSFWLWGVWAPQINWNKMGLSTLHHKIGLSTKFLLWGVWVPQINWNKMGLSTPHHKIGLSTKLQRRVCTPYKIPADTKSSPTLRLMIFVTPKFKIICRLNKIFIFIIVVCI